MKNSVRRVLVMLVNKVAERVEGPAGLRRVRKRSAPVAAIAGSHASAPASAAPAGAADAIMPRAARGASGSVGRDIFDSDKDEDEADIDVDVVSDSPAAQVPAASAHGKQADGAARAPSDRRDRGPRPERRGARARSDKAGAESAVARPGDPGAHLLVGCATDALDMLADAACDPSQMLQHQLPPGFAVPGPIYAAQPFPDQPRDDGRVRRDYADHLHPRVHQVLRLRPPATRHRPQRSTVPSRRRARAGDVGQGAAVAFQPGAYGPPNSRGLRRAGPAHAGLAPPPGSGDPCVLVLRRTSG